MYSFLVSIFASVLSHHRLDSAGAALFCCQSEKLTYYSRRNETPINVVYLSIPTSNHTQAP